MILTKNVKIHIALALLCTFLFRIAIHYAKAYENFGSIHYFIVAYAGILIITSFILSFNDKESRIDKGFSYHAINFIFANHIWLFWVIEGFNPYLKYYYIKVSVMMFAWLIILAIHFIVSRKGTIKGVPKEELFE